MKFTKKSANSLDVETVSRDEISPTLKPSPKWFWPCLTAMLLLFFGRKYVINRLTFVNLYVVFKRLFLQIFSVKLFEIRNYFDEREK